MNRIIISIKLCSLLTWVLLFNGCALFERTISSDDAHFYASNLQDTATYHVVQPGETVSSIAQRYGRHYQDVARWNHISSPYTIYPGQRLLVSGPTEWQTYSSGVNSVPVDLPSPIQSQPLTSTTQKHYPATQKTRSHSGFHQVARGETLYRIAQRYGLNVRDLAAWNQIAPPYALAVGQKLRLTPPANSRLALSAASTSEYYTVQAGDTLYSIAKRFGYRVADIKAWNALNANGLAVGQQLRVKSSKSRLSSPKNVQNQDFYTVRAGDTLYSIAKRYNLSVAKLKRWNQLSSNELSIGTTLQLSSATPMASQNCHTVQQGETLYRIAQRYGYSVAEIAQWNQLPWPYTLTVGQALQVSPTAHCS